MENNTKSVYIAKAAVIAAIYIVLTYVSYMLGISSVLRLSEVMCFLPMFSVTAIPGLFVGCLLANILTGEAIWSAFVGSLATLIGAIGTYRLRNKSVIVALLPPVIANTVIVPILMRYVYGLNGTLLIFILSVGIGEILSCEVLGGALSKELKKRKFKM